MRVLRAVVHSVVCYAVMLPLTGFAAVGIVIMAHVDRDSPLIERIVQSWSKAFLAVVGVSLEVVGREQVDEKRDYVVVSNHLSTVDIPAHFLAVPVPIRFLAKRELFRIPLLAQAMRALRVLEVDRRSGMTIPEQINAQVQDLAYHHHSLIVYPEGTRSRTGELQGFKKGAFAIAIETGLPILPIAIEGTRQVWRPESLLLHPGHARVVIGPPIETSGMEHADVDALTARVRAWIEHTVSDLKAGSTGPRRRNL